MTKFTEILHEKIKKHCYDLFEAEFYGQAAAEAMKQVEIALKDATVSPKNISGKILIDRAFSEEGALKLLLPFETNRQTEVRKLFTGAFQVYRNPLYHENQVVTKVQAGRILALASELIELIDICELSIHDFGGIKGLINPETGIFRDADQFIHALEFFQSITVPEDVFDGYWEDLAKAGISEEQELLLFSLKLVTTDESPILDDEYFDYLTNFRLTNLGQKILKEAKAAKVE